MLSPLSPFLLYFRKVSEEEKIVDVPIPHYIYITVNKKDKLQEGQTVKEGEKIGNQIISLPGRIKKIYTTTNNQIIKIEFFGKFASLHKRKPHIESIMGNYNNELFMDFVDMHPFIQISYSGVKFFRNIIENFFSTILKRKGKIIILTNDKRFKQLKLDSRIKIIYFSSYRKYLIKRENFPNLIRINELLELIFPAIYNIGYIFQIFSLVDLDNKRTTNYRVRKGMLLYDFLKSIGKEDSNIEIYEIQREKLSEYKSVSPKNTIIYHQEGFAIYSKRREQKEHECFLCGNCKRYCPYGIYVGLYRKLEEAGKDIKECIECGICDIVCPANLENLNFIKRLGK